MEGFHPAGPGARRTGKLRYAGKAQRFDHRLDGHHLQRSAHDLHFCGVRSGREMDKLAATGLTVEPAKEIAAPVIAQSPLALECRVKQIIPLGSHDMFLAEIVAVDVEERLLDETGKLHLEKAGLMAYSHGEYFAMGKKIGSFGYSVRKKRPKNPTGKRKK